MNRALSRWLTAIFFAWNTTAFAAQYKKMEGRWYNNDTRKELNIETDGDFTRVTFGQSGTGLVYSGSGGGANISIEGPNFKCAYFMAFLNQGARMTLNRISSSPETCFDGIFDRVDREGSDTPSRLKAGTESFSAESTIRSVGNGGKIKLINNCPDSFRVYVIYTMISGGRSKPVAADVPAGANGFLSDSDGRALNAANGRFEIFGLNSRRNRVIRGYDTVGEQYYELPSGKEEGFKKVLVDISAESTYNLPICSYSQAGT